MEMTFAPFAVLAPLVVAVMGVYGPMLIRRGLRGRRVGDHPVCRKCGFDLFGLPADQKVCPECGGDLAAQRAVLIGHRQRRPGLIYTGSAMTLVFLFIVGVFAVNVAPQMNWQQLKPLAWVAWEAKRGDAVAWVELSRRAKAGNLSKEDAQPLVAHALAWQKDMTRIWRPAVGDFVEAARDASLVTDEQWATYAKQAPTLSLLWRAQLHKQPWLPGNVQLTSARAGSTGRLSVRLETPVQSDDPLVNDPRQSGGSGSMQTSLQGGASGSTGVTLALNRDALDAAALGKRTTAIRIKTQIRESWDKPIVEWTEALSGDWELVGDDVQTVEIVPDDSPIIRQQIESAINVQTLDVRAKDNVSNYTNLSLQLKISAVPLPLAYDVYLRAAGGKEWKLTSISVTGATQYSTGGSVPAKEHFHAKRVDLVFRPSIKTAEQTVGITRIWNGELVIHDVPVTWPTTQPAAQ
jgi:hypothetical protein